MMDIVRNIHWCWMPGNMVGRRGITLSSYVGHSWLSICILLTFGKCLQIMICICFEKNLCGIEFDLSLSAVIGTHCNVGTTVCFLCHILIHYYQYLINPRYFRENCLLIRSILFLIMTRILWAVVDTDTEE